MGSVDEAHSIVIQDDNSAAAAQLSGPPGAWRGARAVRSILFYSIFIFYRLCPNTSMNSSAPAQHVCNFFVFEEDI